jgi:hypothetical protein
MRYGHFDALASFTPTIMRTRSRACGTLAGVEPAQHKDGNSAIGIIASGAFSL